MELAEAKEQKFLRGGNRDVISPLQVMMDDGTRRVDRQRRLSRSEGEADVDGKRERVCPASWSPLL